MGNRTNRRETREARTASEVNGKSFPLNICEPCCPNSSKRDNINRAPARKKLTRRSLADYGSVITVQTDDGDGGQQRIEFI